MEAEYGIVGQTKIYDPNAKLNNAQKQKRETDGDWTRKHQWWWNGKGRQQEENRVGER